MFGVLTGGLGVLVGFIVCLVCYEVFVWGFCFVVLFDWVWVGWLVWFFLVAVVFFGALFCFLFFLSVFVFVFIFVTVVGFLCGFVFFLPLWYLFCCFLLN